MTTIKQYIDTAPEERKAALERLRGICKEKLVGYEESMQYNMPTYTEPGAPEAEVAFASQKNYISLYVLKKPVMDQYRDRFPKSRIGKGCIRYSNPDQIDFELVEEIIQLSFETDAAIC